MSERINGSSPNVKFQQKYYTTERQGIITVPSDDLLRRRQQSQLDRQRLLETIRENEERKNKVQTEIEPPVVEISELGTELVLPIAAHEKAIVTMINNNRASVLISETGGGKSTQLPQFLINAGYDHVYVAQGRRAMVDGLAARIQEEVEGKIGKDAAEGYVESIHGGRSVKHEDSRITIATAAALIRMMPEIEKKGGRNVFVLDEIHEDDQYVEAATGVIGIAARNNPEMRVVCASATIDPEPMKVPLGRITGFTNPEEVEVPVYRVEGRSFSLTTHEAPDMNPAEVFLETGAGHRVAGVATRGYEQMRRIREVITEGYETREKGSSENLIFREFSGRASTRKREEIASLAKDSPEGKQIVVLGTPAMRSGITIPGMTWLAYDGMINREKRREDRSRGVVAEYSSAAEVVQFFGRAGRDVSGAQVYLTAPMPARTKGDASQDFAKIYPFKSMEQREDYPEPAIFNSNLSELLLIGATAGAKPEEFNKHILNEQDHHTLRIAVNRLRAEFGAIDDDGDITEIGRLMSRFPVAPELARGLAEAMMYGRSRDHLGRMAVIATAIDAGGFQSQRKSMESANWKHLLRSGSDDDFMAQLDFMIAYQEAGLESYGTYEGFGFAYENDIDYSRMLGASEPTEKVMRRLGLDPRRFELEPPSYEEIKQIRDDFTAGMYGLTYKKTPYNRRDGKSHYFKPVHNADQYPERQLSANSVLQPGRGEIIAGMPQFHEKIRRGSLSEVETIGSTLKVDVRTVGRYAIAGQLVDYVNVPNSSRRDGGVFVETQEAFFGSIRIGEHRKVMSNEDIPAETQQKIIESVQNNPGDELYELRSLANTLSEYRRVLPASIIEQYRRPGAPVDVTLSYISNLLKSYASRTRNIQEIDRLVGDHVYSNGLSVDLFYSTAAREEMIRRSPEEIYLAEGVEPLKITYDNGHPYVKKVRSDQLAAISGPIYIDEGHFERREVLRQEKKSEGRGVRRVSFGPVSDED